MRSLPRTTWIIALLALAGCSFMTDAATRLANDIVNHANTLKNSPGAERTFVHQPSSSPAGCPGAYQVTFDSSGGLGIGCDRAYPEVSYTTTYHRNAVTVPARLQVSKRAGEGLTVTLRKNGNAIELVRIE